MSFLKVLWEIITMWGLWLSLAVVFIATFIIKYGFNYFALFSPALAVAFFAVGILLTFTTVVWIAYNLDQRS